MIIVTIGALALVLLPEGEIGRKASQENKKRRQEVVQELGSPSTLDELAKRPPKFWSRQYVVDGVDPKEKEVRFVVRYDDGQRTTAFVRFDDESYAFIVAHKQCGLAEIVSLWRAEHDAKQK